MGLIVIDNPNTCKNPDIKIQTGICPSDELEIKKLVRKLSSGMQIKDKTRL